jgi:3-(3-hydroxy-phenyl)propionate hydroxylase
VTSALPVLVVGAGPVGLTAANLLAARGVPVVLAERNAATSDEAKAISLDDESLRTLQFADLAERVLEIVVPGTGTRYYDRRGRPLFHARGPKPYRLGYPFKNQFAQPELERLLLSRLRERENIDIRFSAELTGIEQNAAGARANVGGRVLSVSWVLGCDGGRSTVRELHGTAMTGTSHQDLWLVADTLEDTHDERYGMHHGTPRRPTVVVPGRGGRCRYEFRLAPGEGEKGQPDFATLQRLLAPWRAITPEQVERSTNYTFNAVVADRWREGRCFLLGDAAHMMPPFAGQGLNSGIRDAANLCWKIAEVWHGRAREELLDTYQQERFEHAKATVALSERLGRIVMTTGRRRALIRDLIVRAALLTPKGRRYLEEMRFRPRAVHRRGFVLPADSGPEGIAVGTMLPQPSVLIAPSLRRQPLDRVLGEGFALLGVDLAAPSWDAVERSWLGSATGWLRRIDVALDDRLPAPVGGRQAIADADGDLQAALAGLRGCFVLVKPDRYIAAAVRPADFQRLESLLGGFLRRPAAVAAASLWCGGRRRTRGQGFQHGRDEHTGRSCPAGRDGLACAGRGGAGRHDLGPRGRARSGRPRRVDQGARLGPGGGDRRPAPAGLLRRRGSGGRRRRAQGGADPP